MRIDHPLTSMLMAALLILAALTTPCVLDATSNEASVIAAALIK